MLICGPSVDLVSKVPMSKSPLIWKNLKLGLPPDFFLEYLYMLGSQENNLGPKFNVKFFTVDPYTLCYRVSRPFPIWSIWQIWPLLGAEKHVFWWFRQLGISNMNSFVTISGFFGPPE